MATEAVVVAAVVAVMGVASRTGLGIAFEVVGTSRNRNPLGYRVRKIVVA